MDTVLYFYVTDRVNYDTSGRHTPERKIPEQNVMEQHISKQDASDQHISHQHISPQYIPFSYSVEKYRTANYILVRAGLSREWLIKLEDLVDPTDVRPRKTQMHRRIEKNKTKQSEIKQSEIQQSKIQQNEIKQRRNELCAKILRKFLHKSRDKKQKINRQQLLQNELEALAEEIDKKVDYPNECFFVLDDELENGFFERQWERVSNYVKLRQVDYIQGPWTAKLITDGKFADFVVLGYKWELLRPLWQKADRIKSLEWYMTRREWNRDVREFVEELEWEYGLLVNVHLLDTEKGYEKILWHLKSPVKILDATGETKVKVCGIPKGSLYVDLYSMREKNKEIADRGLPITYFCVKNQWKLWQKDGANLDTTGKNGYNTLVNRALCEETASEI